MTKKEAKERAEVLLAFVEGKDTEYKLKGTMSWITCHQIRKDSSMSFNFEDYEYRIKKEPEFHPSDGDIDSLYYITAAPRLIFIDGAPFAIKK